MLQVIHARGILKSSNLQPGQGNRDRKITEIAMNMTQMFMGHGQKRAASFGWLSLKGNPPQKKGTKGGLHWATGMIYERISDQAHTPFHLQLGRDNTSKKESDIPEGACEFPCWWEGILLKRRLSSRGQQIECARPMASANQGRWLCADNKFEGRTTLPEEAPFCLAFESKGPFPRWP